MALESYGLDASFLYRKFLLIPYGKRGDFKLPSAVVSEEQRTFFMAAIKRHIGMTQMILRWKDMTGAQFFFIEQLPQVFTV